MNDTDQGITLTTKEEIAFFHMCQLRARLKLEIAGMKVSKGPTAYKLIKSMYGQTGSREAVLRKLENMIQAKKEQAEKKRMEGESR